jgi:hypothetical protein
MALPDLAYQLIGWFSTTRFDRHRHHIPVFRLEPASPPGAEL